MKVVFDKVLGRMREQDEGTGGGGGGSPTPLATAVPKSLGTATAGTGGTAARADHVHPTTGLVTTSEKGTANGVATLGSDGKVPVEQLPSGIGGGSGDEIMYKVNGNTADENGNFEITAEDLGAALEDHTHVLGDVTGLMEALNSKSDANHTHNLVSGIALGNDVLTGDVSLKAGENILFSKAGQNLTVTAEPFAEDAAESLEDANTDNTEVIKVFSGTQEEWDDFTKESGVRYIVFIRE